MAGVQEVGEGAGVNQRSAAQICVARVANRAAIALNLPADGPHAPVQRAGQSQ